MNRAVGPSLRTEASGSGLLFTGIAKARKGIDIKANLVCLFMSDFIYSY